jgi:transposase InsO family protein
MEHLFVDLTYVKVFVDNIVVHSNSVIEHEEHLRVTIARLNEANLKLNLKKCKFYYSHLLILGHVLSKKGISLDPSKMLQCRNIPVPTTLKQLQSLLGLFNYLRDYIPRFAELAYPLERLKSSKNIASDWKKLHQESFMRLCETLEAKIFIHHPRFDLPLLVATDASKVGIGGILYQTEGLQTFYIRVTSRALSLSEMGYSAVKRELLAIVHCLTTFHIYLWGNLFTLLTDSRILTFIFTQKDLSPLLLGWLEIILDYTFDIKHLAGIRNVLPDAISRLWPDDSLNILPMAFHAYIAQIDHATLLDTEIEQRPLLLQRAHLLGHFGVKAIVDSIRGQFKLWPGITKEAHDLVLSCIDCQRFSIKQQGFHPLTSLDATLPMDHISIDLAGPFQVSFTGKVYILVMIDIATRFVCLRAISDKLSITIAQELFSIFCLIGFPKILQSDNGTEFVNLIITELTKISSIDHRLILPYHPRANGIVERPIGTMKRLLFKLLQGFLSNWDRFIPAIQYAMNVKIHPIHNSAPFDLFLARTMNTFKDYSDVESKPLSVEDLIARVQFMNSVVFPEIQLRKKALIDKRKSEFEKTHKIIKRCHYPIGSDVMFLDTSVSLNAPGHVSRWSRAIVVGYGDYGSYTLANLDGSLLPRNTAPSQIKPFLDKHRKKNLFLSTEFKAILNHRLPEEISLVHAKPEDFFYLVLWNMPEITPLSNQSWEPASNFDDLTAIRNYWKRRKDVITPTGIMGGDNVVSHNPDLMDVHRDVLQRVISIENPPKRQRLIGDPSQLHQSQIGEIPSNIDNPQRIATQRINQQDSEVVVHKRPIFKIKFKHPSEI